MKGDASRRHEKPAMVIAVIALVIALSGTAFAAVATSSKGHKLPPNSVGSRQIKANAVTTAKIGDEQIEGAKVADNSLSGDDFDLAQFGRVPKATESVSTAAANTLSADGVETHPAACPAATRLIHGICFDQTSSGPVTGVTTAADACAEKGGYLPTTEELAGTRGTLNLGDGTGSHNMFTDSYIAEPLNKEVYGTMVVSQANTKVVIAKEYFNKNTSKTEPPATEEYICTYPLIR